MEKTKGKIGRKTFQSGNPVGRDHSLGKFSQVTEKNSYGLSPMTEDRRGMK